MKCHITSCQANHRHGKKSLCCILCGLTFRMKGCTDPATNWPNRSRENPEERDITPSTTACATARVSKTQCFRFLLIVHTTQKLLNDVHAYSISDSALFARLGGCELHQHGNRVAGGADGHVDSQAEALHGIDACSR